MSERIKKHLPERKSLPSLFEDQGTKKVESLPLSGIDGSLKTLHVCLLSVERNLLDTQYQTGWMNYSTSSENAIGKSSERT